MNAKIARSVMMLYMEIKCMNHLGMIAGTHLKILEGPPLVVF